MEDMKEIEILRHYLLQDEDENENEIKNENENETKRAILREDGI